MEKEACYAICVALRVALANRINSKVLRNIMHYDTNQEVDRGNGEKSAWEEKIGAPRRDTSDIAMRTTLQIDFRHRGRSLCAKQASLSSNLSSFFGASHVESI